MMRLLLPLLLALLVAVLLLGGVWQPHDPDAVNVLARHQPPSLLHPLGTDNIGRDVASRMLVAGWRTAIVVIAVGAVGFAGGSLLGTLAAILGGAAEQAILRFCELFIVVPTLIWALTAAAIFGLSPLTAGIAMGLAGVGPYALMANSLTRRTLGTPYVQAARALGVGSPRLMARHVLPNTLPVMFTHVGSNAGQSVVNYASLAFIGLGADPSRPDWGSMLFEYRMFVFDDPMLMIWPGLAIATLAGLISLAFDRSTGRWSYARAAQDEPPKRK
jgi:peptide/nickel transport system permease protein